MEPHSFFEGLKAKVAKPKPPEAPIEEQYSFFEGLKAKIAKPKPPETPIEESHSFFEGLKAKAAKPKPPETPIEDSHSFFEGLKAKVAKPKPPETPIEEMAFLKLEGRTIEQGLKKLKKLEKKRKKREAKNAARKEKEAKTPEEDEEKEEEDVDNDCRVEVLPKGLFGPVPPEEMRPSIHLRVSSGPAYRAHRQGVEEMRHSRSTETLDARTGMARSFSCAPSYGRRLDYYALGYSPTLVGEVLPSASSAEEELRAFRRNVRMVSVPPRQPRLEKNN